LNSLKFSRGYSRLRVWAVQSGPTQHGKQALNPRRNDGNLNASEISGI
jgi:hypothetical protein